MSQGASGWRKSRTTAVRTLLVVAAFGILLAYMLLVEARRGPPPDPEATPTPWPILSWEVDDLRSIHVTDGTRVTHVERQDGEWRIVEPSSGGQTTSGGQSTSGGQNTSGADPRTIYFPLLELAGLEARLLVSQEVQDKAAYGLDVPSLTITAETLSGDRERLYAGRVTPDGTAFYVQREGDPRLYIVDHYKIELFQEWLSTPPYRPTPAPDG
jgi:hypothetical protein